MFNKLKLCFAVLLLSAPVLAQCPSIRKIQVTGTAEVRTVPDQVELDLVIETFDKDPSRAKAETTRKAIAVMNVLSSLKVEARDIQSRGTSISSQFVDRGKPPSGFSAQNSIHVTLRDISRFEELTNQAVRAGASSLGNVEFQTSKLSTLRQDARKMALAAAKKKATEMALEFGQQIGRVLTITEGGDRFSEIQASYNAFAYNAGGGGGGGGGEGQIAPGVITISEEVAVEFELQ